MLTDIIGQLITRDLKKLKEELDLYSNESSLWKTVDGISNSGGNLSLHLVGNLRHFFGAVLGGTGYVRDRDLEFSAKGVSRAEILSGIDEALADVKLTLETLSDDALAKTYPIEVFGHPMTTGFFLTHLATHLTYHLGQVNYHRRLVANS